MTFIVENTSETTVNDYRVEVEFPAAFLHQGWHPSWEESERQNKTHRFFRMTKDFFEAVPAKWTLYGKDKRKLFSINFYVDKDNYRAEFLNQTISVNVYSDEALVDHVEQSMTDIVADH